MFFGYTLTKTDYETKHISATISAGFDPIRIILTKQSTDRERIADAQFTMTYYNKDLISESELPSTWEEFETVCKDFVVCYDSIEYDNDCGCIRNSQYFFNLRL